ncbi:hypothetical protein LY71_12115 [Geodermatophilus tzadiensis]|uniref:Uncharacterized protein n=1 Tax=Geodermatophilus tzadiensis TaxID=1137988 RepID=A0A2T0T104_9ACTN|nr:hypothetical protein [Geodermatophilus tzadiensis]PRY39346.1 hypothetical protein LY71_12115 [Geodermatophilus tzadiensis]
MTVVDIAAVRGRVAERVAGRDDEDVAVRVFVGEDGALHVDVTSRHPLTYYSQGVTLRPDGRIETDAPDDGSTSSGARGTEAGTATGDDEAVELVVREVEDAARELRRRQMASRDLARPDEQPAVAAEDLAVACEMWQGGRDSGSSRLRGAAHVLAGVRHYFSAPFITAQERQARVSLPDLRAGIDLLRAVNAADHLDANGWNARVGLPVRGFAGRGLAAKPEQDPQIERQLRTGSIEMPLWGVSLSPAVAKGFGTRFLFELAGPFPAAPTWVASGVKAEEEELVTGGRYRVLGQEQRGETTHVRLRWIGASGDRVGSDDLLLDVLSTVPGVVGSSLTRSAGAERLELRLGAEDSATVTRARDADEVRVVRYWPPTPGRGATGDDPNSQWAATRAASRTTTEEATVEATVAAVRRGRNG